MTLRGIVRHVFKSGGVIVRPCTDTGLPQAKPLEVFSNVDTVIEEVNGEQMF